MLSFPVWKGVLSLLSPRGGWSPWGWAISLGYKQGWEPQRAEVRACGVSLGVWDSLAFEPRAAVSSRCFLLDHAASARAHKFLAIGKDTLIKILLHHPRVGPKAGYIWPPGLCPSFCENAETLWPSGFAFQNYPKEIIKDIAIRIFL